MHVEESYLRYYLLYDLLLRVSSLCSILRLLCRYIAGGETARDVNGVRWI